MDQSAAITIVGKLWHVRRTRSGSLSLNIAVTREFDGRMYTSYFHTLLHDADADYVEANYQHGLDVRLFGDVEIHTYQKGEGRGVAVNVRNYQMDVDFPSGTESFESVRTTIQKEVA